MTAACLKLLCHQQRQRGLALTFPFLLGALRKPVGAPFTSDDEALSALVSLLSQLRDTPPETALVRIYTCPDLGQPVASMSKVHYYPSYSQWGVPKPTVGISIDSPYRPEDPSDMAAVAQLLWPLVSQPVLEGRFSYSKGTKTYEHFDASARKFIFDALAYDEENQL